MALITTFWFLDIFLFIGTCVFTYYLWFLLVARHYWSKRNIPHAEPHFVIGNSGDMNIKKNFPDTIDALYPANKNKKILGMWLYTKPMLLVFDIPLIKAILVKDFQYFHDRGIPVHEKTDPLEAHLFNLNGLAWRNLRVKLTPTFTSGKMKMMYPIMLQCGKDLQDFLEKRAVNKEVVEMKDVLSCYTTNVISSCAFGIETNCLENPNNEFRYYGKKIFKPDLKNLITNLMGFVLTDLDKYFTFKRQPKEMDDFFINTVRETMEYREKNNVKRKDFLDLLIQLRNKGYVEDADSYTKEPTENSAEARNKFTVEQAAAQAFIFFAAGFETSSTGMTFTFYELAKNPDIQRKLQKEIDVVLAKHNNEITYEAIQEMEYLDCIFNETLRMYPPAGTLFRECTKDYKIPDMGVTINKGTSIMIPISAIQMDPEYYPEPHVFRPERFLPAEKAKRDSFLHIPFGEGPRICIGNRFALLQSKLGMVSLFSKYNFEVAEETPIPMKYDPTSFVPTPINGMHLKIVKREL